MPWISFNEYLNNKLIPNTVQQKAKKIVKPDGNVIVDKDGKITIIPNKLKNKQK